MLQLGAAMDFGVYVHVPYCRVHCPYCTFYTVPRPQEASPMQLFLKALAQEWHLRVVPRLQRGDRLRTLYLGGGTPSDLPPADLTGLLDTWGKEIADFGVEGGLAGLDEVTIECNPESATPLLLDSLQSVGVHRVSLGVQALHDDDLGVLGRVAAADVVRQSLRDVAQRFTNWNADWIVGVPHSSWERLRVGLEQLLQYDAPHLSFYCLEMPPGQARKLGDIPGEASDDFKADLYEKTSAWIEAHGYDHYEISNAAKPDFRAVHNQAYWEGRDYVGLGPGAHSLEGDVRRANRPDLKRWQAALEAGEDPPAQQEQLTAAMRHREVLMLGLRRRTGIDLAELGLESRLDLVEKLIENGLGRLQDGRLVLTPKGWLVSDAIVLQLVAA
jgi:oxygen-independent coproporphyrinogen-3 oxidase